MIPIRYGQPPVLQSQSEFNDLDFIVMGLTFDLHNEMGNLWDKKEYQNELVLRCIKHGLEAYPEVPVTVSHKDFSKTYFIDLLVNGSVYELKTVSAITDRHHAQTLNYLFLTDTLHGKIVNFRPDSLTWRFVSTTLRQATRLSYTVDTSYWTPEAGIADQILETTADLLAIWGAYLSISLYREALCSLVNVPIENEHQRFIPITNETILHVSGLCNHKNNLRRNLEKYLKRSSFNELLWINFNQNKIEFYSLNHSA